MESCGVRVHVRARVRLSACCRGSRHVTTLWLCRHGDVVEEGDGSKRSIALIGQTEGSRRPDSVSLDSLDSVATPGCD